MFSEAETVEGLEVEAIVSSEAVVLRPSRTLDSMVKSFPWRLKSLLRDKIKREVVSLSLTSRLKVKFYSCKVRLRTVKPGASVSRRTQGRI